MKKVLAILMAVCVVLSLVACASSSTPEAKTEAPATAAQPTKEAETATPAAEKHKIGWSCHYWNAYNTGMDAAIQAYFAQFDDIEVITTDANNDATKQVSDIEDLISQGIEVLIVKAQDDITIANVLGEARAAGIKVILLQRTVQTDNYDYFVGASMTALGREMGENVLKNFPEGNFNYVFLEGGAAASTDIETVEGVAQVFEESGLPGIVKLDGKNCQANRAESKPIVEDWITAYGDDIDVLLSANDEMLMGAIQALQEAGRDLSTIYLAGVNCTAEIVPYILDGSVNQSFAINCGIFPGLELAEYIVHGKDLSFLERNWYEFPVMGITKDNIGDNGQKVIDSGLYMFGLLEPVSTNPLYENLGDLYPDLVPLLHDSQ